MRKFLTIFSVCAIAFQLTSCKSEAKKEEAAPAVPATTEKAAPYSLKNAKNAVEFTAYKTTAKVPVKGIFKKIEVINGGEGNSVKEAINGAEFKIPVSGIETKDASRNFKIQKFFFGVMDNTISLTGKLLIDNDSIGTAELTMNGVTQKLPFSYTIQDKVFTMNTTMDVLKWNAQSAVDSLNVACKDLHKGEDGVSKTWSEVAINAVSTFE
ncbi:YceI family protein [Tenacibaculum amylolyticum]|uniref:YceI family protein n=1 Tax=Tenacibaculum amylolyticum TaxID=104269 RepID=UPI003893BCD7